MEHTVTTMTGSSTPLATPPQWSPSSRELDDAEVLLLGAYAGLRGFLGPEDLAAVRARARLADGTPWPLPVTLQVPPVVAERADEAGSLALLDEEGAPVARVRVEQVWDLEPGLRGVAGPVEPMATLERGSHRSLRPRVVELPATRRPVLGVPIDSPPLEPELARWRSVATAIGASIRLFPLTGDRRARLIDGPALVRTCLDAATRLGADVVPVAVPHHGDDDRDRLATALIAGAYGATHVPGPVSLPDREWGCALPVMIELPDVVRDGRTGGWELAGTVPPEHRGPETADDAAVLIRRLVAGRETVPGWLAGPAVGRELSRARGGHSTGFTVLLTGLSGSGKSTVAKALHAALLERTARTVTLLDGDRVRSMLSSELTFSREHRELNVRRIGFVAAEVTRHGGIALCAPIAPYATSRDEVRAMVGTHGGFVLVHVATPLATCESRDRKGLYARARAGLLPEFTGVSDPYECPVDADLVIDSSVLSAADAVERILEIAVGRGWLELTGR